MVSALIIIRCGGSMEHEVENIIKRQESVDKEYAGYDLRQKLEAVYLDLRVSQAECADLRRQLNDK